MKLLVVLSINRNWNENWNDRETLGTGYIAHELLRLGRNVECSPFGFRRKGRRKILV